MRRDASCPSLRSLARWFDCTLDDPDARQVDEHVAACVACRNWLLRCSELWMQAASPYPDCPRSEHLLAYCSGRLEHGEAMRAATHLERCTRCVALLRRIVFLRPSE